MRVERLELVGFKSFAEKTVFNFHHGITAIVGPNGCGKSNVVDAFKWVLGEQSAKSLRGDSMEDVIFLGSATKKTKGMAEVTLVLSDITHGPTNGSGNEEKTGISEISVTRRLFRSGESEYLMNKVPCRLKDIRNVFLDTGLELKAYSILEQGRMDQILSSKPLDRRFLIEEVAGVMKYKVRRTEALNKLDASRSNLQRIQDIITEVKRQINTIDRHAKKAERYKKLFEEIRDIELRIAKRDSLAMQSEIAALVLSEGSLKERESETSAHLHAAEALIEEKKRICTDSEKHLADVKTRLYALEKEVTEDEGKIALLKSDCDNLRERSGLLIKQGSDLDSEKERTEQAIRETESGMAGMSTELTELEAVLEEKNSVLAGAENEIRSLEQELETQRRGLFNKAEEISMVRNEMGQISMNIENINRRSAKSSEDISLLNENMTSLQTALEDARNQRFRSEAELNQALQEKEALVLRLRDRKQELSAQEEALYREREEAAAMTSKLESLRELDQLQMSSVDEHIRAVCQVADIFETSSRFETAIEAVLGDKLGAAVVDSRDEIKKAVRHIREQKTKRSGFISMQQSGTQAFPRREASGNGVLGNAFDFVTVKEGFQGIAESVLNDVTIVENLDSAFSMREGDPARYYVTLEGEVLEPSGMVFVGSGKEVLKVKRMIKELDQDLTAKRTRITEAEKAVSDNRENIVTLENDIISADGRIFGQEKYCHALELKITNLQEEDERTRKKHEYISLEMTDNNAEKEHLSKQHDERTAEIGRLENEKIQIEGNIRYVQERVAEKREALEGIRAELTDIRMSITSIREKILSLGRELERLNTVISDIARKKDEMARERAEIEESILSKGNDISAKENEVRTKIVSVSGLRDEMALSEELLESRTAELAVIEKQQRSLASELEAVREELNHVEMKKMELSMKLNYLVEDVRKTYSLEIGSSDIAGTVTPEEEEELVRLKERLQELGPVSLGTLDEYEELKTRYDFLAKQRDDLQSSIEALQDTIQKINRTTQHRLTEAFNALNDKFREVFTTLFGKGRAELHLTDDGNILDAGIEIVAQPPGKKLQNLMLLSGGEKALTALSLLFAGFMIKPTPLCLLDEVDAPLDESNTDRFITLLKELAKGIQFITITHNRRTMEAANYIYGITMEEPGSSKVVSMHLTEAEAV